MLIYVRARSHLNYKLFWVKRRYFYANGSSHVKSNHFSGHGRKVFHFRTYWDVFDDEPNELENDSICVCVCVIREDLNQHFNYSRLKMVKTNVGLNGIALHQLWIFDYLESIRGELPAANSFDIDEFLISFTAHFSESFPIAQVFATWSIWVDTKSWCVVLMRNFLFIESMNHLIQFFLSTDSSLRAAHWVLRTEIAFPSNPLGAYYFEPFGIFATFFPSWVTLLYHDGEVFVKINTKSQDFSLGMEKGIY